MKTKTKKIAVAALAGAGSLLMARSAAQAALTVTWAETSNVTVGEGTFDRYIFEVTAITGADNVAGPAGQDPEVLLFEGTWTATGGNMLVPGANTGVGNWTNYIVSGASSPPAAPAVPGTGNKSSYVNLPNLFSTQVRSGTGTVSTSLGSATNVSGTSASFTGHWDQGNPGTTAGPAGGIEPSLQSGRLAIIYVAHGASISFAGDYGTYQTSGGNPVTTLEAFTTVTSAAGHAIISLTAASGGAPANYGSKQGSTMTVTGSAGHYSYASTSFTGVATGYVEAKTFNPTTDEEIYALDVTNGGNQATDAATIAGDINSGSTDTAGAVPASTGVTASTSAPAGTTFPGGPYNLYLTIPAPATASGDNYLGFDLSQDFVSAGGNVANGDVISAAAVVPEPASAAFILIGASGMLLGRKRKSLPVA